MMESREVELNLYFRKHKAQILKMNKFPKMELPQVVVECLRLEAVVYRAWEVEWVASVED